MVEILASEAKLKAAQNNAQALVAEAEAENNSTAGLEVKRKFELEWKRLRAARRRLLRPENAFPREPRPARDFFFPLLVDPCFFKKCLPGGPF